LLKVLKCGLGFYDSLSAKYLTWDYVQHGGTKHIDVKYHFSRNDERIVLKKINTKENLVDFSTR